MNGEGRPPQRGAGVSMSTGADTSTIAQSSDNRLADGELDAPNVAELEWVQPGDHEKLTADLAERAVAAGGVA